MTQQVTKDVLDHISAVYRNHDVDGIADCFTEDGCFVNAKGVDLSGDTYRGKDEIAKFFRGLFDSVIDVQWNKIQPHQIAGNFAVTQWHRVATTKDGVQQSWLGCDLYEFDGTLIKKKDTYIKIRL